MIDSQFCAQGYCEIFKNHPKKFLTIISQSFPHKTVYTAQADISHSATKFEYVVVWYVPTKDPSRPAQGLSCPVQQSQKEILFPKKLSTKQTVQANITHSATKFKYVVPWYAPTKDPQRPAQRVS